MQFQKKFRQENAADNLEKTQKRFLAGEKNFLRRRRRWKLISPEKERAIMEAYKRGMTHRRIILLHDIPEGQYYNIIRKINTPV